MIGVDYVRRMARYNRWQNENLYGAAAGLTDEERHRVSRRLLRLDPQDHVPSPVGRPDVDEPIL